MSVMPPLNFPLGPRQASTAVLSKDISLSSVVRAMLNSERVCNGLHLRIIYRNEMRPRSGCVRPARMPTHSTAVGQGLEEGGTRIFRSSSSLP